MASRPALLPGLHEIDAYGNGGFRFAGMSHRGSILALPSGMRAWPVTSSDKLVPEHFSEVFLEMSEIGFLILGTGPRQSWPPKEVERAFGEAGLVVDTMDTGAAVRTYNVLLAEKRPVAAALIAVDTAKRP